MLRTSLALLLATLLQACAAAPRAEEKPPTDPRTLTVFNGATGAAESWDYLLSASTASDLVILGENHGHPLGLALEAALWSDLLQHADRPALSLEFFERDEQAKIDDYLCGITDEKTFRERTARTAGNYPPGHREMVEAAKAAHRPVIASNAPRPYTSIARKESYDRLKNLSAEQQRLFRIPDVLPSGRYADDFYKLMADAPLHGLPPAHLGEKAEPDPETKKKMIEGMFRAQSLWDWTMADSVARAAAAGNRPVFHIVGRFHVDHEGGLVLAAKNLRPSDRITTISVIDTLSDTLRREDRDCATYVIYVGPSVERARGR